MAPVARAPGSASIRTLRERHSPVAMLALEFRHPARLFALPERSGVGQPPQYLKRRSQVIASTRSSPRGVGIVLLLAALTAPPPLASRAAEPALDKMQSRGRVRRPNLPVGRRHGRGRSLVASQSAMIPSVGRGIAVALSFP